MSQQSDEEMLVRNYLLGSLDEEGQEQVEELLLCDDSFAERMFTAQDNLIDEYVFDALPENERESFEKNFHFTDERRKKLLFAQTMKVYVDEHPDEQAFPIDGSHPAPPSWRNPLLFLQAHKALSAISLAGVVLLIFFTPKIVRWLTPPDQVALFEAQRASIERQIAEVNKHPADPRIETLRAYDLSLQPTVLRADSGIQPVILTEDIKLLNLKLALSQVKHDNYQALVSTVEGKELFAVNDLASEVDAGGATVLFKIPTEFLPTGDYQIQLRVRTADGKIENVRRYHFRVTNKR